MIHLVRAGATVLLAAVLAGCSVAGPGTIPPGPATPPATVAPAAATAPLAVVAPPSPSPITGWPQTLAIPKLTITAPIVGACVTNPNGSIEPPTDIHATCVTGRPDVDPAGTGTTTLTGHTTRAAASTGALERIGQLTVGDVVTVADRTWTVTEIGVYPATALPERLFTTGGPRLLVLGTCHLDAAVAAGAPYTQTDLAIVAPAIP